MKYECSRMNWWNKKVGGNDYRQTWSSNYVWSGRFVNRDVLFELTVKTKK